MSTILAIAALPFPSVQGTQVLVGAIAEGLAGRGHDVHLLCYGWGASASDQAGAGAPTPSYRIHRVAPVGRYRSLRSGPSWQKLVLDARLALELPRLVRSLGVEVVLAHGHEALAATVLCRDVPVVYHAHTRLGPELPTYFTGMVARTAAAAVGAAADRALPLLAHATATVRRSDSDGISCSWVPPAVPLAALPAGARDRDHLVYTGNLDNYQGLEVLLEAIADVPEVRLTMASGSSPGPIAAQAARRGLADRIRFVPHVDLSAVRSLLGRASVAVVPRAIPTGFPVKLLEAMAAAAPVAVSSRAVSGLVDGREVRLFDDATSLARVIRELVADPVRAEQMGRRGRAHLERAHDPERAIEVLEAILERARGVRAGRTGSTPARPPGRGTGGRRAADRRRPLPARGPAAGW